MYILLRIFEANRKKFYYLTYNMSTSEFSEICNHDRITRIDDNFVRCAKCGQSMISKINLTGNKTRQDFTNENKSFRRNFNRNFTNEIEEVDQYSTPPIEYYTDINNLNYVIIDRTPIYKTDPIKYKINFNGDVVVMSTDKINEILQKIRAVRIDAEQFKYMFINKNHLRH